MTMTTLAAAPETEGSGNRRSLLVAGGLVAALALGGGGYVLMSGGSSEPTASGLVATHRKPVVKHVTTTKKTAPTVKKPEDVPAVSTVPLGRDPFRALYLEPVSAPAGQKVPLTSGGTSGSPTSDTPTVTAPYSLKLLKVYRGSGDTAPIFVWAVSGKSKTVIINQKFGKYGELVTLAYVRNSSGKTTGAILQVGDDEPVAVKLGDTITVK